jgi:hypothetical protein
MVGLREKILMTARGSQFTKWLLGRNNSNNLVYTLDNELKKNINLFCGFESFFFCRRSSGILSPKNCGNHVASSIFNAGRGAKNSSNSTVRDHDLLYWWLQNKKPDGRFA